MNIILSFATTVTTASKVISPVDVLTRVISLCCVAVEPQSFGLITTISPTLNDLVSNAVTFITSAAVTGAVISASSL